MIYLDLSAKKYVDVADFDPFWEESVRTGPTTASQVGKNPRGFLEHTKIFFNRWLSQFRAGPAVEPDFKLIPQWSYRPRPNPWQKERKTQNSPLSSSKLERLSRPDSSREYHRESPLSSSKSKKILFRSDSKSKFDLQLNLRRSRPLYALNEKNTRADGTSLSLWSRRWLLSPSFTRTWLLSPWSRRTASSLWLRGISSLLCPRRTPFSNEIKWLLPPIPLWSRGTLSSNEVKWLLPPWENRGYYRLDQHEPHLRSDQKSRYLEEDRRTETYREKYRQGLVTARSIYNFDSRSRITHEFLEYEDDYDLP